MDCRSGVAYSQVEIWLWCEARRTMSIQLTFKISLETDSLGTTAVMALNNGVATGGLAESFTAKAADRNEVVVVVTDILDTGCATCGNVVEAVIDLTISQTTSLLAFVMLISIVFVLIALWVFVVRDMRHSKAPADFDANIDNTQIFPALQIEDTPLTKSENEVRVGTSTEFSMVALEIPSVPMHLANDGAADHHPLDIVQAAALHCG